MSIPIKKTFVTFRLTPPEKLKLNLIAENRGVSASTIVRELLNQLDDE